MQIGKTKIEQLDYNYYQRAISNLKSTMPPQEVQRMMKKQQIQQQQLKHNPPPQYHQISNIYPYITLTNNFSFNPYQMRYMPPIHLPVTPYPNNNNQTRTLRTSSVRPPPKPNTTMLGKLISPAQKIAENVTTEHQEGDQSFTGNKQFYNQAKITQFVKKDRNACAADGEKINEHSHSKVRQNESENEDNSEEVSNCLSSLSDMRSIQSNDNQSEQSREDQAAEQGRVKFFPMEQSQLYFNDESQEEAMAQYKVILKSVLEKGFGLKAFYDYVKETSANVNLDLYYESKTRYYRRIYIVVKKIIHSIQYFLAKDCGLKIRKITLDEYSFIRKYLLHYKKVFKKSHIKTMEKIIKIILNLEDVTLTESKVKDLHQQFLNRIDRKFKQEEGVKHPIKKLSQVLFGPPYTLRGRHKCQVFYRDNIQNQFQDLWKTTIQKEFIQYYRQRTSYVYCHEKLCLLYPQYKKYLSIYHLKCNLQRVYRMGFGNLLGRIKSIGKEKLPRLSPISNDIFKKIMVLKNYWRARYSLIRLYQQEELTLNTAALYIRQLNQCLRQFQAIEGLLLIKKQYFYKQPEMNVISLRPRFIVKKEVEKEEVEKFYEYNELNFRQQNDKEIYFDENQENVSSQPHNFLQNL